MLSAFFVKKKLVERDNLNTLFIHFFYNYIYHYAYESSTRAQQSKKPPQK